jgi:hypothetical protein
MASKLTNLSELQAILSNDEKTNEGILHFHSKFKISRLMQSIDAIKVKGYFASVLVFVLCIYRLRGFTVWAMHKTMATKLFKMDENTLYRFMNNERINWRKLLMGFARQFKTIVHRCGDQFKTVTYFIIDDTDLEKTGKTFEFISRIHNHVRGVWPLGFKMLTLGYWDGKSLIAVDFSLHREKGSSGNYGLTRKERRNQFSKQRDPSTPSMTRIKELDKKKTDVAVSMIKRAVKNGFVASYVLMDSWFTNDYVIKSIRSIKNGALHFLGMCKIDSRKYDVGGKPLNSHQIITRNQRKRGKYSRKHKSEYIAIVADYKGTRVKLFYIRYRNAKSWTLILTTDLSLKFTEALERYQIRWTIEVLFKECKQYLKLGACQNTDFDGQIADATIALITHTILTLQRRFEAYETMGELFRETQQQLLELTLWERILKAFIKMLRELMEILSIDLEETIEKIMASNHNDNKLLKMLEVLSENPNNDEYNHKLAA